MKNRSEFIKKIPIEVIAFMAILVLALLLFWVNTSKSNQAASALYPSVTFEGEYRIGDGEWKEIVEGEHISSTQGDVTLRGMFYLFTPMGEYVGPVGPNIPIAFFLDHIHVTMKVGDNPPHEMDIENQMLGPSSCGEAWIGYSFYQEDIEEVEMVIHNPHRMGNETAIDELIANFSTWINMDFEREMLAEGDTQRNIGYMFVIASLIVLGTAIFSTLLNVQYSREIWLIGLSILFAGGYSIYSADGVYFWSESIPGNTTILGCTMMLYMLSVSSLITYLLNKTKYAAVVANTVLGFSVALMFMLPISSNICFYDTWLIWVILQSISNLVLFICLIVEIILERGTACLVRVLALIPLFAFEIDVYANVVGLWKGGIVSQCIFSGMFIIALIMVLRIFPNSIQASMKAKELEAEKNALDAALAESRISTMISQIRPHFIYNALGSIEQLCDINPKKAAELSHNFAKYLRGNFGELDNPKPIKMSQEMEHVKHYISIENVRFPDMSFTFEMNSVDFELPALTVQPIIENAIKHGLMKLEKGGSIRVTSYETDTHYCVRVEDDGVGFDTSILLDERKHIGLRNIRGRLEAMVHGELEIESTMGVGTKVMIKIPKEENR